MTELPLVEVHVVHHCNLNCCGCAHFAPLARPWFITVDQLRAGLAALVNAGVRPKKLRLFGGEPLLHPLLEALLAAARELMPATELCVLTNGMLPARLLRLAPVFKELNIVVEVTTYPTVDQPTLTKALHLLGGCGVCVRIEHDAEYMRRHRLTTTPAVNAAMGRCVMTSGDGSLQLTVDPVRLWWCPVQAYAWIAAEHFGGGVPTPGPDSWLDLATADADAVQRWMAGPPPEFCRHCTVSPDDVPWAPSEKRRDEW